MRPRSEEDNDIYPFSDHEYNDHDATLFHKRQIRKKLEECLERKRLRHELEDYDEDDVWDEWDKDGE